jgi:hypothetical protein
LCFIGHTGGGDAESARCPGEVVGPGVPAQRQAFAEGGSADLDGADAGLFQIEYFVPDERRDPCPTAGPRAAGVGGEEKGKGEADDEGKSEMDDGA